MAGAAEWNLLGLDDPRWPDVLRAVPHDVYHLPGYLRVQAQGLGRAGALLVRSGGSRLLLPLLLRPIPGGQGAMWDATSPYGYPSPLLQGPLEAALMPALMDALRELELVSVFLRLHPLLPLPPELVWPGTCVRHGPTYFIDLRRPREDFLAGLNRNSRRQLRALAGAGLQLSLDDWSQLPAFQAAYAANMRRVGAQAHYGLGLDHLQALRAALPDALHLLSALDAGGQPVGGVLFSVRGGLMQQMYQGVTDAWAPANPARLFIVALRDYGAALGLNTLHLGGGLGSQDDGIARFKRGMATGEASFSSVRLVPRPALYRRLAGAPGDPAAYFPAYRRPADSGAPEPCPGPEPGTIVTP